MDINSEPRPKSACEVMSSVTCNINNNSHHHSVPLRNRHNTYESSRVKELKEKFQNRFVTINEPQLDGRCSPPRQLFRPVSSPIPPSKPPRTFAHDVYVQEKEHLKALVEVKYRQGNPSSSSGDRRRSKSVDMSTSPVAATTAAKVANVVPRRKARPSVPSHVSDIFTIASSNGHDDDGDKSLNEVTDILNQSFGKVYESTDEYSIAPNCEAGDIGARVNYAKSLRSQYTNSTVSHFISMSEMTLDSQETVLCKFIYDLNHLTSAIVFYPISPSHQFRVDLVNKFTKCYKDVGECFSWFTLAHEHTLIHTYFYTCKDRTLAVGSELYSPNFFDLLLKNLHSSESTALAPQVADELLFRKIPLPGESVNISGSTHIKVPSDSQITSCKPSMLLTTINPENLYHLIATLVAERKAVLVSSNPINLTDASKAVISLLFPLYWDYMYWPVVPGDLITWCAALSMPYFIGIESNNLSTFLASVAKRGAPVFILDIDSGQVVMNVGDEDKILPKIHSSSVAIALNLAKNMCDPSGANRDSVTREVFLTVFVQLLGPVTPHITEESFDRESFLNSLKSKCTRNFLRWFIETRTFENFKRYWQLRLNYYKYVPPVKFMFMDPFERKSEHFRTHPGKKFTDGVTSKSVKYKESSTNGSAMKGIESRFRAIKTKLVKNAFK